MIGVSLGILIGLVTGLVVVLIIRGAWRISSDGGARSLIPLVAEILAIPTFWFGGSWISGKLLTTADLENALPQYLLSLTCTFVPIAAYPLLQIIIAVGREIGRAEVSADVE
jgi:hypothetical protein